MSGIINKVKEALHSDKDTTTTGTHGTTGHNTTATHGTGLSGSTNAGPHDSNLANKADPRIDSDLDRSRNAGLTGHSTGHTGSGIGSTTHSGSGIGGTTSSSTAGPHSSDIANKLDPRVDSDLDRSHNAGMNQTTGHSTTHSGLGQTHGSSGIGTHSGSTNAGPHGSNVANTLDPRVDSDLDNSRTVGGSGTGYGSTTHSGLSGTHGSSGIGSGTHTSSGIGSGTHGSSGIGSGAHTGSSGLGGAHSSHGTAGGPNTAGPHGSDMLNKLDPRVDSDLDGSKTVGGNKTYYGNKHVDEFAKKVGVPFDAAKHKPSELHDATSEGPNIAHGDGTADYYTRHGSRSESGYGHYGDGQN